MTKEQAVNISLRLMESFKEYENDIIIKVVRDEVIWGGEVLINIGDFRFGYKAADDTCVDHIVGHIRGILADNNNNIRFKNH